jgi:hypothetical protein
MAVFPLVTKLDISYWRSYCRIPLVKAFPAVIQLTAFTSLSSAGEYKEMMLDDMKERLDEVNSSNAQPCEGWQYLDHVEGDILVIHALTVPSRISVRRLYLDVDVDHSWSVARLRATLEALRPTVLELCLTCGANIDLKCVQETWTPSSMASVQCLVLTTIFSNKSLGLCEFTVCISHFCCGLASRSQLLIHNGAQEALPHHIGQLSVTHLHIDLDGLQIIHDGETIELAEREDQREAYADQLAKSSESLRYLKLSAGCAPVVYWLVDREGEDAQPTLRRLSKGEGESIENESFEMSSPK